MELVVVLSKAVNLPSCTAILWFILNMKVTHGKLTAGCSGSVTIGGGTPSGRVDDKVLEIVRG